MYSITKCALVMKCNPHYNILAVGTTETEIQRGDYPDPRTHGVCGEILSPIWNALLTELIIFITILKSSLPGSNWTEDCMKQNWWLEVLFGMYEHDFTMFFSAYLRKNMKPGLTGNSWLDWMEMCTHKKYHSIFNSLALSRVHCLAPVYQLAERLCITTRHKWSNELRCRFHKSD